MMTETANGKEIGTVTRPSSLVQHQVWTLTCLENVIVHIAFRQDPTLPNTSAHLSDAPTAGIPYLMTLAGLVLQRVRSPVQVGNHSLNLGIPLLVKENAIGIPTIQSGTFSQLHSLCHRYHSLRVQRPIPIVAFQMVMDHRHTAG